MAQTPRVEPNMTAKKFLDMKSASQVTWLMVSANLRDRDHSLVLASMESTVGFLDSQLIKVYFVP